jgi:hypothetical protein
MAQEDEVITLGLHSINDAHIATNDLLENDINKKIFYMKSSTENFGNTEAEREAIDLLFAALKQNKYIKYLYLNPNEYVERKIADYIIEQPNILTIRITPRANYVFNALKEFNSEIELYFTFLDDFEASHLNDFVNLLENNSKIYNLSINYNNGFDVTKENRVLDALEKNNNLTFISIDRFNNLSVCNRFFDILASKKNICAVAVLNRIEVLIDQVNSKIVNALRINKNITNFYYGGRLTKEMINCLNVNKKIFEEGVINFKHNMALTQEQFDSLQAHYMSPSQVKLQLLFFGNNIPRDYLNEKFFSEELRRKFEAIFDEEVLKEKIEELTPDLPEVLTLNNSEFVEESDLYNAYIAIKGGFLQTILKHEMQDHNFEQNFRVTQNLAKDLNLDKYFYQPNNYVMMADNLKGGASFEQINNNMQILNNSIFMKKLVEKDPKIFGYFITIPNDVAINLVDTLIRETKIGTFIKNNPEQIVALAKILDDKESIAILSESLVELNNRSRSIKDLLSQKEAFSGRKISR